MTLFDEETLKHALAQAADEFRVSTTAPDRILEHAMASDVAVRPRRIEAIYLRFGRAKTVVMSLAASVVVVAVAVPLFLSEVPSPSFSAIPNVPATEKTVQGSAFSSGTPG